MIIESGNCMVCGSHIDGGGLFLCAKCREENKKCRHERLKVVGISTARPERPIMEKGLRQKPRNREERSKQAKQGGVKRNEEQKHKVLIQ